jgi:2-dehydro-3-deoxygalactonokinase
MDTTAAAPARSDAPGRAIAIDWGSTRLRAWLLDADGAVLDRRDAPRGAIGLPPDRFDGVLAEVVGDWARAWPDAPMIACGMVGARGAMLEAPYVDLPASLDAIRTRVVHAPTSLGRSLAIVAGLRTAAPDVLRGEETQALGCGRTDALLCLPGTHSKWLRLRAGVIDGFRTWLTGELYAVLCAHGSLAKAFGAPAPFDETAFDAGVADAQREAADADWLAALFGFRARVVGAGASGAAERARLSGWLLGTELRQALSSLTAAPLPDDGLVLVGEPALAALYERALPGVRAAMSPQLRAAVPARFVRADAECAARGLHRIVTGR